VHSLCGGRDVGRLLAADDLPRRLSLLGFWAADLADTLAAVPAVLNSATDLAHVQAMAERLSLGIGRIDDLEQESLPWRWRTEGSGSAYGIGVLEMLALVAITDEVRAFHRSRGIGPADSWRALSDLGQQIHVHRLTYGQFGLHTHDWLRVAWSGALYWLGRLQFNLQRDVGADRSDWVLSTHIPRSGPLIPQRVGTAFAWARRFFVEHFAEYDIRAFYCSSWLLDPELARALPATSNIAQFQRRWTLHGQPGPGDDDAIFFTFDRRPPVDLATLPRDTTLQRVILDRLAAGGHWRVWDGRIELDEPAGGRATAEG
ncbi:MAG: acyltransferase domain-containing protein, partial [Microlunatus sp.]|nr:acyltransferase domain-containing protein [Microlunatus sp.]